MAFNEIEALCKLLRRAKKPYQLVINLMLPQVLRSVRFQLHTRRTCDWKVVLDNTMSNAKLASYFVP